MLVDGDVNGEELAEVEVGVMVGRKSEKANPIAWSRAFHSLRKAALLSRRFVHFITILLALEIVQC